MADGSVCSSCGTALPLPDLVGLMTCPNCGLVAKADAVGAPAGPPDAGDGRPPLQGWPEPPTAAPPMTGWAAPPVAAPPPDQWAAPQGVQGAPTAPEALFDAGDAADAAADAVASVGRTFFGKSVGCLVTVFIVFVFAGASIFGALASCDPDDVKNAIGAFDALDDDLVLSGSATVLPGGDGTEVVAVVQRSGAGGYDRRLGRIRFSGDTSSLVWRSEPLGDSVSRAEVAVVGKTLFAAYDDKLLAVDAATGATRWKAILHDKVTIGCPGCFASVGGKLVVRTTDAYVTGYGTTSAEPLWTKRLNSTVGSTSVAGGRLFVVDDPEDASKPTPVQLVDPATGSTIRSTTPACPRSQETPWDLEVAAGDPIRAVPGTSDVIAVFGFGDACVMRWNPETGTVRWNSRLNGMSSVEQDDVLVGERDLVLSGTGAQIVTVYLPNGKARQLEVPSDVQARPGVLSGRTLVGYANTTRGTTKGGLIGWDLGSGKRLFANADLGAAQPVSSGPYHSSDALFEGSPRSLLVTQGGRVSVFVFEGTDGTFMVAPVDVATGRLGRQVRRAFLTRYDSGGTPSLTVEGQDDDQLVVSIDSLIQTLPISGTGPVVSYPPKD